MNKAILRDTRKRLLGLTYLQLHNKTGIYPSVIHAIEQGRQALHKRHLNAMTPFLRRECLKRAEELRKRAEELA